MNFLYVMDPMCSWCWAFAPTMKQLQQQYPDISVEYLMGGLAPDSDAPMPQSLQQTIQSTWRHINQHTGTSFNHDFWTTCQPRRSTYPACRAVLAAEQLREGCTSDMINAIQQAYYLDAKNPSDISTLSDIAVNLGLDEDTFIQLMESESIETLLQQHLKLSRQIGANGFPSLYLATDNNTLVPISLGYSDWETVERKLKQEIMRG